MDFFITIGAFSIFFAVCYSIYYVIRKIITKDQKFSKKIFFSTLIGGILLFALGDAFTDSPPQNVAEHEETIEENEKLTAANETLESENKELSEEVTELETTVEELSEEMEEYKDSVASLEEENE